VNAVAGGPGAIVQSQRESLGLTRQDIADSLNLSVRVVEALETENWRELPGPAFVRGYLRAYAKLLDLDADAVTQVWESAGDGQPEQFGTVGDARPRPRGRGVADLMQKHPGAVLGGAVGAVICAVAVVLMAVWPHAAQHGLANAATAPSDTTPQQPAAATAATSADPSASSHAAAADPAESRVAVEADERGVRRITPTGDDRLTFAFAADCWVEIKYSHGAQLFSNLGKSGDHLELVGHPPFHIVLGNAPAVTLQFNNERVTLTPHTRNNVGTLVLGQ